MDPIVILGDERVAVGPGQEHRLPVRIRNQGRRVESYRVDVVGAPSTFAEVVPTVVSVLPGREAQVDVVFRPPGGAGTPTGTLPFAVRATSEVDASSSAATGGQLELAGVVGLQAWAPETTRRGRWSTTFDLQFANEGSAAARIVLTAHEPSGMTKVQVQPDVVDLQPGGRSSATLKARARAPFLRGSTVNRMIRAASQTYAFGAPKPDPAGVAPTDDPNHRTFQLTFEQRPILPKFVIPLAALLLVGLLALAVITLRRDQVPQLGMAAPIAPVGAAPPSPGSSTMLLSWRAVPNAEGYRIDQSQVNGQLNQAVVVEDLPPEATTYEVKDLTAGTQYCFEIRALGADADSDPLELCATTNPPTELAAPTAPTATHEGEDRYRVTWEYPNAPEGVQFSIYVDGTVASPPGPLTNVVIPIESSAEERTVSVRVRAELGAEVSELSPEFLLTVVAEAAATSAPAETAATSAPVDTAAPSATATTVTSATTVAGATTTAATTTTAVPTTLPPPVVSELQDLEPGLDVAMLGEVLPPSQGGVPIEQRKAELSERFGVPVAEMDVFTNRDTVVASQNTTIQAQLLGASAAQRFIYVTRPDATQAAQVCSDGGTGSCFVLELSGAAATSEGRFIAIMQLLGRNTTTAQVDELLDATRENLQRDSIHVLDGAAYDLTPDGGPVIYATGFASEEAADAFCAGSGLPPGGCLVQQLPAAG